MRKEVLVGLWSVMYEKMFIGSRKYAYPCRQKVMSSGG